MKWHNWYFIPAILISLIFRLVIPFFNVFKDGLIRYNTVDAYYFVDLALKQPNNAWSWLIRILGTPFNIEIVAAFLPVILFLLTIPFFYIIVRLVFNSKSFAGLSTIVFMLIPGEFLYRTSLGASDHHCLEIFLLVGIISCILTSLKYGGTIFKFSVIGLFLFSIAYYFTWNGYLLLPFILGIWIVSTLLVFINNNSHRIVIAVTASILGVFTIIYNGYWDTFLRMFTWKFTETVAEELPLLFNRGFFDLSVVWGNYSILFYLALAGLGILFYDYVKSNNHYKGLIFIWSAIIIILTLAIRRWNYYMAINISILATYFFWYINSHMTFNQLRKWLALGILIFPLVSQGFFASIDTRNYIEPKFAEACQYIKTLPKSTVLSWWDTGYWIEHYTGFDAYCDPGRTDLTRTLTANLLLSDNEQDFISKLKELNCKYVLIDNLTYSLKRNSIIKTSTTDKRFTYDSMLYTLWGEYTKELKLIFNNGYCKIYTY